MAEPLRVVVDGAIFQAEARGGISRVFRELLPRMCDLEESVTVTLLYGARALRQPLPSHPRIHPLRLPQLRRYLRPGRLWNRLIPGGVRGLQAKLDARLVGSGAGQLWHSTYFTLPPVGWRGAQVVTVHDMIYERFPELFDRSWLDGARARRERCVRTADAIIAISETTRSDLQQFYGVEPARVHVVPNAHASVFRRLDEPAADDDRVSTTTGSLGSLTGRPFLLYVGNRSHYKSFDTLLDAYARWQAGGADVAGGGTAGGGGTEGGGSTDLVAVGGGAWSEEERSRLRTLGLEGRVHQLEGVTDEALCRLYNQATAFVYPSLYEGFGLPLLEAMACGCVIVASDIPSTREVAGDVPVYFKPGKSADLGAAIERVSGSDRGDRVERGIERAARFSWDSAAKETLAVYREAREWKSRLGGLARRSR